MYIYALYHKTVTVYRYDRGKVSRRVFHKVHFWKEDGISDVLGAPMRRFSLVIPGSQTDLAVGDRVFDGIGPEEVCWEKFIPANVSELVEVGRVWRYRLSDQINHVEAAHGWN